MSRRPLVVSMLLAGFLVAAGSASLHAQVTPQDAETFLGDWTATVQGPQGAMDFDIHLSDEDGTLSGQVSGPQGAANDVEEFSMSDDDLVLGYTVDFGGQSAPVDLTLTPEGEGLQVEMSFAGGQFSVTGTAVRQ